VEHETQGRDDRRAGSVPASPQCDENDFVSSQKRTSAESVQEKQTEKEKASHPQGLTDLSLAALLALALLLS